MSTSFVVNLGDLNKILEQIKIAERNAAGESLVDIIGQDAALQPLGLRTVDGSFNHLLPGQSEAGAADQNFFRLLTPVYLDDGDHDQMPLGPPPAPVITNTNYDPTIAGTHDVADADPRIISNLIVDQTLNNRSALVAALVVAGSENANAEADQILAARAAVLASAAPAYQAALVSDVPGKLGAVITELNAVQSGLGDTIVDAVDKVHAQAAVTAANSAKAAQASVVAALLKINAPELGDAQSLLNDLSVLATQANAIKTALADNALSPADSTAVSVALGHANALSTPASDQQAHLTAAELLAEPEANARSAALDALTAQYDIEISPDGSILIENRSPDVGLSPPNSAWMTFFGQFFDHGLDLVTKGGNGTIFMPLQPDDPLIAGADHIFGTTDDLPASLRFMTLSRVTPFDENGLPAANGTESQNTTTPFVDQNQTYTSSASHQVFLREYKFTVDSADPDTVADSFAMNTGHLLNGVRGGIATWGEVKLQATEKLGLTMNDLDVLDVPKLAVDAYGNFIAGPNGFAQVYVSVKIVDATGHLVSTVPGNFVMEGKAGGLDLHNLPAPLNLPALPSGQSYAVSTVGTGHAFLNDIAHTAAPVAINGVLQPDDVVGGIDQHILGNPVPSDNQGNNLQYDNELLDSHFATGDGRGNENIGLTAVHTIFHSEHNRLVEAYKHTILESGDLSVINEWLVTDLTSIAQIPTTQAGIDALDWDGSRLFQAGRFVTEMQYQHLVFEEFARRIQPNVDPFVFTNSAELNPAILAEFAHTVYRFGHSMLTDTVDRLDNNLNVVGDADPDAPGDQQTGLIAAFLNPQMFSASGADDEASAGALIRGMSRQVGNEIDEFVVEALRNNLLGLPLDLPALNLARGRDTGIPSLNDSRAQIYDMTGAADVKPYTSWIDFAQHIKHPLSIVNFIAAYGTHPLIAAETTSEGKRAAAMAIVLGTDQEVPANAAMNPPVIAHTIQAPADRLDFLNAIGLYAPDGAAGPHDDSRGGLNHVDLWIGGLAEELNEFGGELGSTFNYIFEYQMEHLQNGDRFYYLSRTQGMNLLNLLEPNTFTDLVMRNTDLGDLHATHLPGVLMSVPDMTLELDRLAGQANYSGHPELDGTNPSNRSDLDPTHNDPFLQAIDPKVVRVEGTARIIGGVHILDADGQQIFDGGILKFSGGEHVTLGGTEGNDFLYGDKGIDTLWGDGGDDYLNAGMESDQVFGGDGDDIIEDPFGDNFLRGEAGNDVIASDTGLSLLFGGEGQDFIMGNTDKKEFFAGPGNDFVLGGSAADVIMGNEGDDWVEGGEGFDDVSGGNSELFFNSIVDGNDILNGQGNDTDYDGENGDDIMVDGPGIQRNNGMDGFDWTIFKGDDSPVDADLGIRPFDTRQALILRDRFDSVEGLSGWDGNDILTGGAKLLIGENFTDALTQAGVDRIHGMRAFLGPVLGANTGNPNDVVFESDINTGGEIILGGDGNDTIRGNLGDDILDGDAWLNVRISVHASAGPSGPTGLEIASFEGLTTRNVWTPTSGFPASWQQLDNHGTGTGFTLSLAELMRSRLVNPGQLEGVREILTDTTHVGNSDPLHNRDIAVFSDIKSNYTIETVGIGGPIGDGDGDGFITVAHTPVVGAGGGAAAAALRDSDGIDKIRNFEILNFADGNIFLDPSISNTPATGLLSITITNDLFAPGANVGDTFAVGLGNVSDADGPLPPLSQFTFGWEFEATPGAGDWEPVTDPVTGDPVFGATFTPTPAFEIDGLRLRAVGTFHDAQGIPEVVFSSPTDQLAAQAVAVATTGDDVLVGTNGPDFIDALAGDDDVKALGGSDIVIGGPGSDTLDGGAGTDAAVFFGPFTNFTFSLDADGNLSVLDNVTGDEDAVLNFETLVFIDAPQSSLNQAQITAIVADALNGIVTPGIVFQTVAELTAGVFINDGNGANTLTGTEFNDIIFGNGGDDIIDGLGGDDLLVGGNGDDDIDSGGANDTISGGDGTNTIRARAGDETFLIGLGENGSDTVRNDRGTERLSVGAVAVVDIANQTGSVVAEPGAINTLAAGDDGAGNLVVTVNNKTITITDHFNDADSALELINFNGSSFDGINLGAGDYNLVAAAAGVTILNGGTGNDALFGTSAADTLNGNAGNDLLLGGANGDTLNGGDGNDILDGGNGADTMSGGTGDDIYVVDAAGDIISEAAGAAGGVDTVSGGRNLNLVNYANVENITLTGTGSFNATGNSLDNVLTGNSANNTLDGVSGVDTAVFAGAAVAATFGLTGGNVTVTTAGGGTDTLLNIDKVRFDGTTYALVQGSAGGQTLTGGADADLILGFGGADTLIGNGGNDFLDGGAGVDTMTGGTGDDTYVIDDVTGTAANRDAVVEAVGAAGGIDTVSGEVNLDLANYANVENITLTGTGSFNAIGNGGNNVLIGNSGVNQLTGGAGDDTYGVTAGDTIVEAAAGGGVDTVTGAMNLDLASYANVENILLTGTGNFNATGNAGANAITGNSGNNTIVGGQGNDLINGGSGNDTINWDIANAGPGDGHDIIDGGTQNAGSAGDTFSADGNNQNEVYRVYSNTDDWDNNSANGIVSSAAHANLTGLAAGTEIVVTRNTDGLGGSVSNANIIAELTGIEEIVINTHGGTNNVLAVGNFNATALSFNTITVNDDGGSTTVDLSQLTSAHHVAFHTTGDDDAIIGARPQDQVFADGSTTTPPPAGDGDDDNENDDDGNGGGNGGGGDDDENENEGNGNGNNSGNGNGDHACGGSGDPTGPDTGGGPVLPPEAGLVLAGTPQTDVLTGGSGDDNLVAFAGDDVVIGNAGDDAMSGGDGADFMNGGAGRDVIFAGAGDDQVFGGDQADVIYGDAGADRLFGDQGNDMITAGAGDDSVFGGAGDDLFVAELNDGNDIYFGDDSDGGSGIDTLDISAATADTFVDLGSGSFPKGSASSIQTGNDTLWGIENVNTGSGNDTIVASNAANVMNGGTGNDTFKFTTAASADHDTIFGFSPGDRIDLSAIDANTGTTANDAFTLITGAEFTAAGQLAVSFESRADGDFTVIQGNVDGNMGADFTIEVEGHQTITSANVTL